MNNADIVLPSNRKFGVFFGFVFLVCFVYFLFKDALILYLVFLLLSGITFAAAFFAEEKLQYFNMAWLRIGLLLGKIANPLVMGVIFYLIITPVAIFFKFSGRDELDLKIKNRESHWKVRSDSDVSPESFKNQF